MINKFYQSFKRLTIVQDMRKVCSIDLLKVTPV